jgi:2-oxoglutarate ferredoxin oxidoreductase subunit alpha
MPTWSGQGDLLFAIHASQDELPRLVLTPGDPQECFTLAKLAQNLAEKYQLPVIILTDKYLGESYFSVPRFETKHQNRRYGLADTKNLKPDEPFKRYQDTATGLSPRPLPGQPGGVHLANSYEHDEFGYATEESAERTRQVDKRAKKILQLIKDPDLPQPQLYGPKTAARTLVSWGSNKGVILQALKNLPDTNFIHFPLVWPFPKGKFLQLAEAAKKLITLECNSTGQFNRLIKLETSIDIKDQLLKYDGRPFFPSEIKEKLS